MQTIEIGFNRVGGVSSNPFQQSITPFFHMFIRYTDPATNTVRIIQAGPGGPFQGAGTFWGHLTASNLPESVLLNQSPGAVSAYEVVAAGADLSGVWQSIVNTHDRINGLNILYDPRGPNSNSFVVTALIDAGLPLPSLDRAHGESIFVQSSTFWTPGTNLHIGSDRVLRQIDNVTGQLTGQTWSLTTTAGVYDPATNTYDFTRSAPDAQGQPSMQEKFIYSGDGSLVKYSGRMGDGGLFETVIDRGAVGGTSATEKFYAANGALKEELLHDISGSMLRTLHDVGGTERYFVAQIAYDAQGRPDWMQEWLHPMDGAFAGRIVTDWDQADSSLVVQATQLATNGQEKLTFEMIVFEGGSRTQTAHNPNASGPTDWRAYQANYDAQGQIQSSYRYFVQEGVQHNVVYEHNPDTLLTHSQWNLIGQQVDAQFEFYSNGSHLERDYNLSQSGDWSMIATLRSDVHGAMHYTVHKIGGGYERTELDPQGIDAHAWREFTTFVDGQNRITFTVERRDEPGIQINTDINENRAVDASWDSRVLRYEHGHLVQDTVYRDSGNAWTRNEFTNGVLDYSTQRFPDGRRIETHYNAAGQPHFAVHHREGGQERTEFRLDAAGQADSSVMYQNGIARVVTDYDLLDQHVWHSWEDHLTDQGQVYFRRVEEDEIAPGVNWAVEDRISLSSAENWSAVRSILRETNNTTVEAMRFHNMKSGDFVDYVRDIDNQYWWDTQVIKLEYLNNGFVWNIGQVWRVGVSSAGEARFLFRHSEFGNADDRNFVAPTSLPGQPADFGSHMIAHAVSFTRAAAAPTPPQNQFWPDTAFTPGTMGQVLSGFTGGSQYVTMGVGGASTVAPLYGIQYTAITPFGVGSSELWFSG